MAIKRPNPVELLAANADAIIRARNLDLKSVAHRCGFSEKTLYNILNGKHAATLSKIDDIARALGVQVSDLLKIDRDQSKTTKYGDFLDKIGPLSDIEKMLLLDYLGEFRSLRQRFLSAGGAEWSREKDQSETRRETVIRLANDNDETK